MEEKFGNKVKDVKTEMTDMLIKELVPGQIRETMRKARRLGNS